MGAPNLVSFDIYGHKPQDIESFRTKSGLFFSTLVFVIVLLSCGYVCYEYFDAAFDVVQSSEPYDPEIPFSPNSDVRMPDVGIAFRLKNESVFDTVKYNYILDVQFWQKYRYESEEEEEEEEEENDDDDMDISSKTIRIPTEKCLFEDENNSEEFSVAYCPQWGNLEEYIDENGISITNFISSNNSRESAKVPELQGMSGDPIFATLEATIRLNLTALKVDGPYLELELDDFFSGDVIYIIATSQYSIDDIKVNSRLKKQYKLSNRRAEIKEYVQSTFDIQFSLRTISKTNAILDFDILAETYNDVILAEIVQELDDPLYIEDIYSLKNATNLLDSYYDQVIGTYYNETIPETIVLTTAFYLVDMNSVSIDLAPKATAFDILGMFGGFLSLFSFIFGYPAMLINAYLYKNALKRAKNKGKIPDEYLDEDGNIRFDKINEALQFLQHPEKDTVFFNKLAKRFLKRRTKKLNKTSYTKTAGSSCNEINETASS